MNIMNLNINKIYVNRCMILIWDFKRCNVIKFKNSLKNIRGIKKIKNYLFYYKKKNYGIKNCE